MSDISDLSDLSFMSDEEHMAPVTCQYQSLGSWSLFRCPELIVPEAFVQHPMRIPSQLAAATGTPPREGHVELPRAPGWNVMA